MKKWPMLLLVSLLLVLAVSAACAQTTTIMMYMCGSDIYEDCIADMEELTSAASGSDVNIVVLAGGAKTWGDKRLSNGALNLFTIRDGAWSGMTSWGKANMGSISTLEKFINHCLDNYAADRYVLVLWDHGGGAMSGICFDEVYNDDALTVAELSQALSEMKQQRPSFHLDILGSDACLMATYEMAAVARNYADYYIASEELEPWLGWYYTNWVSALCADPDMSSRDLAIAVVDSYRYGCERDDPNDYLTLSAIDLSKMDALISCVDSLSATLTAQLSGSISTLSRTFQSMYIFGSYYDAGSDGIDMTDFLTVCASYDAETAEKAQTALAEAVLYNYRSSLVPDAEGMAIFVPMEYASTYASSVRADYETGELGSYASFVSAYASAVGGSGYTFSASVGSPSQMSGDDYYGTDFVASAYDYSYGSSWDGWDWDSDQWGWYDDNNTWWTYGYGGDYGYGYGYGSGFGYNGSNYGYDYGDTTASSDTAQNVTGYISGSAVGGTSLVIAGVTSAAESGQGAGIVIAGQDATATAGQTATGSTGIVIAGQTATETPGGSSAAATPAPDMPVVIAGLSTQAPAVTAAPESAALVIAGLSAQATGQEAEQSSGQTESSGETVAGVTLPDGILNGTGFSLALSDEDMDNLSYAEAILLADLSDDEENDYQLLGVVRDTWVDWQGNTVYSLFDGTWPSINGIPVVMYDQSKTERVRRSLVPVLLNDTTFTYLVVQYEAGSDTGRIVGYSEGWSENGLPARGITPLKEGDTFTPVYTMYLGSGLTAGLADMTAASSWYREEAYRIVWDGTQVVTNLTLSEAGFADRYLIAFRLHDVYGGSTDTALNTITLQ